MGAPIELSQPGPRRAFPFGARVRLPLGTVGLVVGLGATPSLRLVAWIAPATGNPVEAMLPTASLTLIALPTYPPLRPSEKP